MKIFLKNNKVIFGNSCSGKTYIYKHINLKNKIDLDFFLKFNNCDFNNELIFRNFESFFIKKIYKIKLINYFIGGGCILNFKFYNNIIYVYKNVNYLNFIKRVLFDNNRPLLNKYSKIKFFYSFRKKKYLKIPKKYLDKCLLCNLKKYENYKI